MKKWLGVVWVIGMVIVGWAAPGSSQSVPTVKIALNLELSGKQAVYRAMMQAARLNVEQKNAAGGIKSLGGAKLELVEFDNATEASSASSNAERIGSDAEILACIGPCTTSLSNAVEPIVAKWKIPTLFVMTTFDQIFERGNPYVYTVGVLASDMGRSYADFMMSMHDKYRVPLNRISIAYSDDEYGRSLEVAFRETLEKRGYGKNLVASIPYDWQAKDLSPIVLKVKGARPDFHCQLARTADGKLYHDACYTNSFYPYQVGGTSGFNHPDLWKALGERIAAATMGNNKTFLMDFVALDLQHPAREGWIRDFRAKYPQTPVEMSLLYGATASKILINAIEKAGKADREAINQALHKIEFKKEDPEDLTSAFEAGPAFESNGKGKAHPFIGEWRKVDNQWQKASLYQLKRGIFGTPKGFAK